MDAMVAYAITISRAEPPDDFFRGVAKEVELAKVVDLEEQITVVAPDDVHDAASRLFSAMVSFREIAAQDPHNLGAASPWEKGDTSAMWDAHDAFITAARADLGVGHRPISNA